jgi:hypothetical protein
MDRRREPLSGAEQRACWTASATTGDDGIFGGAQLAVLSEPLELAPAPLIEARVTPR